MTVKTIALIVFDSAEAEWLIQKCSALAVAFDAHVIGLHAFSQVVFYDGIMATPMVYPTLQAWEKDESNKIKDLFDETMRKNDLRSEFRRQDALYGSETFLLAGTRGADLVVMGYNGATTRSPDDQAMAHRLIRNLGRPVLVLSPDAAVVAPFETIAIGWTETREATRAAHDAIALAKPGAAISLIALVAHAGEETQGFDSRDDLATALDRHGYKVTTTDKLATADHRGKELLRAATEANATLLVAGAFGHSQFYDFMFGAVTSYLLQNAKLPVLLSR